MKFIYICLMFFRVWFIFQRQTVASFQQNTLSEPVQLMHLKSNRSGRPSHSKLHLVPDMSIYKFSSSNVLQCIFDIVELWKETHVIILYRSAADDTLFNSQFVSRQRNANFEVMKWQEDSRNNNTYEIHYLQQNLRSFIVVCCEAFLAQEFLKMMSNTGSFVNNRNILLVTDDYSPIIKSRSKFIITSHLSVLIPELPKDHNKIAENIDIHQRTNFNVLDVFNNYVVDGNSLIQAEDRQFRQIKVMKWSLFKGLLPLDIFKHNTNSRMNEKIIQAGLIHFLPFAFIDKPNSCIATRGYIKEIYDVLSENLYFRMNISCQTLQSAGIQLANGTYTGIMQRVADKEIDVGINPMLMTKWRLKLTQVHTSLQRIQATVWFRNEDMSQTFSPKTHFSAFSLGVWLVFAATFLLVSFSVALVLKLDPLKIYANLPEFNLSCHKKILHFIRWFVFGEFLEQALEFAPGIATKILLGTLNATVTLIFLHYTSIFSSVLTSQTVTLPFTNIEELINNFNYRIGIQYATGYQDMLHKSDDQLYKRIYQRISEKEDNFVSDVTTGLRKVCNEDKYAFFFDDRATSHNAAAREFAKCGLHYMKISILEDYLYTTFRSDFPYATTFSNAIFRMQESGVLERLHSAYFSGKGTSITQIQSNAVTRQYSNAIFAFELYHILIPIGILVTGIILSLLVLIIEVTVNKLLRMSNQNLPLEIISRPLGLWKFN